MENYPLWFQKRRCQQEQKSANKILIWWGTDATLVEDIELNCIQFSKEKEFL